MLRSEVKEKLSTITKLPTIPAVTSKILQIVHSGSSSADDLAKVMKSDQSLTARTLKLVNTAYYGMSKKIYDVNRAIVVLGFNTVKALALSTSVLTAFQDKKIENFTFEDFWAHAIGVGIVSDIASKIISVPKKEEMFVCGIIHDVGKVIMAEYFPEDFNKVMNYSSEKQCAMHIAEHEICGFDHTDAGAFIANKWNFPDNITNAIQYHHSIDQAPEENVSSCIVFLADAICKTKGIGGIGENIVPELNQTIFDKTDFSKEKLQKILNEFDSKFEASQEILKIITEN